MWCGKVTPYAGVWIEIYAIAYKSGSVKVTPYAGVWIEMIFKIKLKKLGKSHSLRGSVD